MLAKYDKTIMLNCGLDMTYQDNSRFPDFSLIEKKLGIKFVESVQSHIIILIIVVNFYSSQDYMVKVIMDLQQCPAKALLLYILEEYRRIWMTPKEIKNSNQNLNKILLSIHKLTLIYYQFMIIKISKNAQIKFKLQGFMKPKILM
ncbi:unnamed protein product [Paramecium pentaurelia]|uniref:Uncharacterized protein n=1 Tax=Paramecium pentaurelia TaxID=43138 RepID=A0A8S1S3Y7_9CILI|nr:unnamed protein product [Paramecium pentaurelia]